MAARRAAPVWLFDLDNTLHDASHAIFGAIDRRMTDYVERELGVERGEANRLRTLYWRRYGATLLGLVRHHGVDPHHFLRETHDFDVAELMRAERGLARLFARLPGRKLLLTNAPLAYAGSVLRELSPAPSLRYALLDRTHARARHLPAEAVPADAAVDAGARAHQAKRRGTGRGLGGEPEGGPVARTENRADHAPRRLTGAQVAGRRRRTAHFVPARTGAAVSTLTRAPRERFGKLRVPSPTLHVEPVWHGPD